MNIHLELLANCVLISCWTITDYMLCVCCILQVNLAKNFTTACPFRREVIQFLVSANQRVCLKFSLFVVSEISKTLPGAGRLKAMYGYSEYNRNHNAILELFTLKLDRTTLEEC